METGFERGLHNNYMIIKNSNDESENCQGSCSEDYQMRMLAGMAEGFLPLKLRYFNGRAEFCYDISLKQKMSDWFRTKKINYEMLCSILKNLCKALENAVDFLLDINHIILNPNYIFVSTEEYEVYLCYYPFYEEDILKAGLEFLQYLLEILDYNDKTAVETGYEIFRLCMKDGFRIDILKKFLTEENKEVESVEEATGNWNSVMPVRVMKEEIEDECEKPIIPYMEQELRKKICLGICILEIIVSLIFVPNVRNSLFLVLLYVLISFLLVGVGLALSVFYDKIQRLTRTVSIKSHIAYTDEDDNYIDESDWEDTPENKRAKAPAYEDTVLLAYAGRGEQLRRLHYIGTRAQEDIMLTKYPFTVGKSVQETDYCLSYPFVSRVHFRIEKEEDKYYITDTNSRNGLLINDVSLNATETRELRSGDRIEIGDLVFLFQ